jgi:hypothetical protein
LSFLSFKKKEKEVSMKKTKSGSRKKLWKLLSAQKRTKQIGHWGENKGILTLRHNNDQKKLASRKKKGLEKLWAHKKGRKTLGPEKKQTKKGEKR